MKPSIGSQGQPCGIVPACTRGNHGPCDDGIVNAHNVHPISQYHWGENDMVHDLGALRRGELYNQDNFYRRLRAWFKAEIGRHGHWVDAKCVWAWSPDKKPWYFPNWEASGPEEIEAERNVARKEASIQAPTRRQPARCAKTKAAKNAARARKPVKTTKPGQAKGETKGDYELAEKDWLLYLSQELLVNNPRPQGLLQSDVCVLDFQERVKAAVDSKLAQILALRKPCHCALPTTCEAPTFESKARGLERTEGTKHGADLKPGCAHVACHMSAETAVMEISPTLGRWPETTREHWLLEDLDENVIKIAGLRFALDVCAVFTHTSEHVRFFML